MIDSLTKTILTFAPIPPSELEKLQDMVKPKSIQAGEIFIAAGQVPKKFGFVVKGLFRYFYINNSGKEFIKGFFPENTFISSYTAMINQTSSFLYIEAIENSEILEIDYQQWHKLTTFHNCWDKFLIRILEMGYGVKEKRERDFLLLDAESRYRFFLEEFPNIQNRVKQHMIASYLGITPIALSRIRKKMGLINIG